MLEEENEEAKIGGENGITLNYETFGLLAGYDGAYHDFSKVGENIIRFLENDGTKTLNVITKESYGNVSASLKIKYNNSTNDMRTQGIVFKFEDGKHAIVRYHNGNMVNGNIQYVDNAWKVCKEDDTLFGADASLNQYGEAPIHTLLDEETEAIKADGLYLQVILKDGILYTFFDGKYVAEYALPEGYAEKKVQVGFFAWNAASNAIFNYEITKTVPEKMETALNIKVTQPEGVTGCAVTATPEKQTYEFGEELELSFTAVKGYKLDTLTIAGENKLNSVIDGKLTITANRPSLEIVATFALEEPIALNLVIKGKKQGAAEPLAKGTIVKFKNTAYTFTVGENGAISNNSVVKGTYIVQVDGYFEKEIVFDESLTEIVLEYDLLENLTLNWNWSDKADLSKQNEGIIKQEGTGTQWVSSKDTYNSVAITATIVAGGFRQGVFIRFKGDSYANDKYMMIQKENDNKVSWNGENNIWGNGSNLCGDWTDYVNPLTDADKAMINNGTYELTLVREKAKIYVFINGKYYDTKTLDASYADAKCCVGIYCVQTPTDAERKFRIEDASKYLADVTITDGTAKNANGRIEISQGAKVCGTVTITVVPADGYMLDKLTVSGGVTPTASGDNVYTFFATEKAYTVTATFTEIPATQAEAVVTGVGLGASAIDMNGKEITFKLAEGVETKLTVTDGKVKNILAAGTYTVSCDGFYDLTATVEESGSFAEGTDLTFSKKLFEFNYLNEPGINNNGDSTSAATEGKIKAKNAGNVFEWSVDNYDDVAFTVTLKGGNGNQGVFVHFVGVDKHGVKIRFETMGTGKTKAQFWDGWGWGIYNAAPKWDFMDDGGANYANPLSDALDKKYQSEGLQLTVLRKGAMIYVLIDGEVYAAELISNTNNTDCANVKVKVGVFVDKATQGYEIPFTIENDTAKVNKMLENSMNANSKVLGVLGNWTVTDTTLSINNSGYAEFAPTEVTAKESLKINIASKNSNHGNHTQGLMYRFENGKWLAARIESNANSSYIQYSEDSLIPHAGGALKGWTKIYDLTDAEKTAFYGDSIELQMVRDGKCIYVMLGGKVIDKLVLDDEYAEMDGVMAATIEGGTGTAYAYEYKTGENVTVPEIYAVNASFNGNAYGYGITLDKNTVEKNGKVTLTLKTQNWDTAWSMYPTKITVNGEETALTTADFISDGANNLHYTKELTITQDTEIKVTVEKGAKVAYNASVNDATMGSIKCDMENSGYLYYWNDACTLTITANEGYVLESLVINGTTITEGWTQEGNVYTYNYLVTGDINITAIFKAA